MPKKQPTETTYRSVTLPGLGQVQVPTGISDAEVLAEVMGQDAAATPPQKNKKKL